MVKTIDLERLKTELPGKQHGEDGRGRMTAGNDAPPDPILVRPARRRVASLKWNERFVIQPFHRSGIFLIRQEPAVRTG